MLKYHEGIYILHGVTNILSFNRYLLKEYQLCDCHINAKNTAKKYLFTE